MTCPEMSKQRGRPPRITNAGQDCESAVREAIRNLIIYYYFFFLSSAKNSVSIRLHSSPQTPFVTGT